MASYSATGRFNPTDYADRIRSIFADNRIVGRGLATHAAAQRLIEGAGWEEAGAAAGHAGNGTAMRAAPVGLLFGDDPEQMIQVAHDQGRITHLDPRCSAGSVAIAGAVALAAQAGDIDRAKFLRQVSEWTATFDADFAGEILRLAKWLDLPPNEAAPIISRCGSPDYVDGWRWISPFVVPSVLWSLYSFLRTPADYWTTIYTSIAAGGDVDTTAAMAGAISGAHIGLQGLPVSLARHVNDQGSWGFDELVALSHRCFAIKTGQIRI
jgi:ADP-ribosylglycohydrolase